MDEEMKVLIKDLLRGAIKLVTSANAAIEDAMKREEEARKQ